MLLWRERVTISSCQQRDRSRERKKLIWLCATFFTHKQTKQNGDEQQQLKSEKHETKSFFKSPFSNRTRFEPAKLCRVIEKAPLICLPVGIRTSDLKPAYVWLEGLGRPTSRDLREGGPDPKGLGWVEGFPSLGIERERADGRGWGWGVVSASDNVHMCCIASLPVRARHEERWI